MTIWLCISTRTNDRITRRKKVWGVAKRFANVISKVKIEDNLLMYTMQEYKNKEILPSLITSEYKVISSVYEDTSPLFESSNEGKEESYPLRIKIKLIKKFNDPIQFRPLVQKLSFIKNKKIWSGSIRTAMREIPEDDYKIIMMDANPK